jgi:hypothetical protein
MARLRLTVYPNGFTTVSCVQALNGTEIETFLEGLVHWEMKGNASGSYLALTLAPGLVDFRNGELPSDGEADTEETGHGRASEAAH